jgi:sec-independent protein translocase protein TatA
LVLVLGIALVVFGPKRLPEIGGALGKGIREFRRGTSELEDKSTGSETRVPETPVPEKTVQVPPAAPDRDVR